VCTCLNGFASSGDGYCNACDSPHHTYPNCGALNDAGEQLRSNAVIRTDCGGAHSLPTTLNTPGWLRSASVKGFDLEQTSATSPLAEAAARHARFPTTPAHNFGRVHLQEVFLLNPEANEESISFEIGAESLFRVYYLLLSDLLPKEAIAMTLYHETT
jgi:hypothetical protein